MDKEVKEIVNMATTIILFGVLLLATIGFFTVSSDLRRMSLKDKSLMSNMKESAFITKMSHSVISGSDISDFMIAYKDKYTYVIINEQPPQRNISELEMISAKNSYLSDADYYNTSTYLKNIEDNILNRDMNNKYIYFNKYIIVSSLSDITSGISCKTYGDKMTDWSQEKLDNKLSAENNKYLSEVIHKNGSIIFVYFKLK